MYSFLLSLIAVGISTLVSCQDEGTVSVHMSFNGRNSSTFGDVVFLNSQQIPYPVTKDYTFFIDELTENKNRTVADMNGVVVTDDLFVVDFKDAKGVEEMRYVVFNAPKVGYTKVPYFVKLNHRYNYAPVDSSHKIDPVSGELKIEVPARKPFETDKEFVQIVTVRMTSPGARSFTYSTFNYLSTKGKRINPDRVKADILEGTCSSGKKNPDNVVRCSLPLSVQLIMPVGIYLSSVTLSGVRGDRSFVVPLNVSVVDFHETLPVDVNIIGAFEQHPHHDTTGFIKI